ncbi:MAG TPA: N-acetylmuramoyl-L-alanine amidase [Sutterella sp.]|nr:N-acetylmuramoyl-L-alanine amidase [Sutterella sp.]
MSYSRRAFLKTGTLAISATALPAHAATPAEMLDVRIWPNKSYTRVTLEHTSPVRFKYFMVRSPKPVRLVIDVKDLKFTEKLRAMLAKVNKNDPYISAIRAAQFDHETVRIVMDLKQDATPELFESKPNSQYRYRLIFDIHPAGYKPDAIEEEIAKASKEPVKPEAKPASKPASKPAPNKGTSHKPAPKRPSKIVVVIDAGHGGEDPGAVGRRKTYEKHVTLAIAYKLKAIFDKDPAYKPLMTRTADVFVPLGKRVRFAMANKANLFVSIHADAWTSPSAKGTSCFALSITGATSTAARWLAQSQNEADIIGGSNFNDIAASGQKTFLDMNAEFKAEYSLEMGYLMLRHLEKINTLHSKKIEQAQFLVLKTPGVPSILVESAFISNPEEERKLRTDAYQQKVAQAIYRGIKDQVARYPL